MSSRGADRNGAIGLRIVRRATIGAVLLAIVVASYFQIGAAPAEPDPLEALGARLLSEPRLAADGAASCLSCHQPARGYGDGRPTAAPGGLNTPPLWGLAARRRFGWFSPTVSSLEQQALRPLADPAEMGPLRPATLARLRADPTLVAAYRRAFPDAPSLVTWEQTAAALAAAVRAIPAPPGAYERWLAGDVAALSPAARRGQALFVELGCASCHQGPLLASDSYHNVGVAADPARNGGRARVPSLRGLSATAPYFHDGSAADLAAVVRHYARAEPTSGAPLSPAITPLRLTEQDVRDLVAFLESL